MSSHCNIRVAVILYVPFISPSLPLMALHCPFVRFISDPTTSRDSGTIKDSKTKPGKFGIGKLQRRASSEGVVWGQLGFRWFRVGLFVVNWFRVGLGLSSAWLRVGLGLFSAWFRFGLGPFFGFV